MRRALFTSLSALITLTLFGQKTDSPNYGLKTPSSAEIVWVDFRPDATEICVTITNEIENGYFCFDRNTLLIKPDGSSVNMISVSGLPVCPDTYKFKKIGEEKSVRLLFPATGYLPWISIRENCNGGCFQFMSVICDPAINAEIDAAFRHVDEGDLNMACTIFDQMIKKYENKGTGVEGLLYSNIITLYREMKNQPKADEWYQKLKQSGIEYLNDYLNNLK